MAAAGSTCLSDLSDDLLRRILFFAPARDAAATAVLSRRWRWLWRTSGAVNLDSRSYDHLFPETPEEASRRQRGERVFNWQKREAFFRGAEAALAAAAAEGPISRLTFTVTEASNIDLTYREGWSFHDMLDAVVSNPATGRVEELRLHLDPQCQQLRFASLPREALQVLDVASCCLLAAPPPGAAAFRRLASLRLHDCGVSLVDLQRIVDAAPKLATLHLQSLYLFHGQTMDNDGHGLPPPVVAELEFFPIRCRAVTGLVFADCDFLHCGSSDKVGLEIDAPMLQYLEYKGAVHLLHRFSLKPQASSSMVRVDLHAYIIGYTCGRRIQEQRHFWQFIQNFSTTNTKSLKLKLDFTMDQFALTDKNVQGEILCGRLFDKVERLELEAQYDPAGETPSMATLANLLHICPVVRDLRLKLSREMWSRSHFYKSKECQADFDKSVSNFRRHRKRPMVLPGGDDDRGYDEGFGIPELREHSFSCLKNCLTRVSLHFCMMEPNCLGVQLAKFFIESAMVLEEMCLDDGSHKMCEHVNPGIRRWIASSAKRRKLTSSVPALP